VKKFSVHIQCLFIMLSATLQMIGCSTVSQTSLSGKETVTGATASASRSTLTMKATPFPKKTAMSRPIAVESPGPEISRISLAAVGDVLIHSSIWKDAVADGSFDFCPMFQQVKPILQKADIAFANQESMMGGADIGLSDYPMFNSPFEIGDALKDAGIDIVSMANNHTMDKRETGIREAIARWNAIGMLYVGANSSEEDRLRHRIITKNGIKVAFLAYTFGTNGIPVPADKPYLVNLLDKERLADDIRKVRKSTDIIAVSMHFGKEYELHPNAEQKEWAQKAAEAGADIVLGHHPHVLQPIEWVTSSTGKKTLVFYSLGNFLAAQKQEDPYRQIGGIAQVDLVKHKTDSGTVTIPENVRFVPTYISFRNWRHYQILPFDQITDAMLLKASFYRKEIAQRISQWVPNLAS